MGRPIAPQADPEPPTPASLATPSRTGTPQGCTEGLASGGLMPNQLATAYGYDVLHDAGLQGQGQRLAVIQIDANVVEDDLDTFAACFGFDDRTALRQVNVGGAAQPGSNVTEATLDVQVITQVAPKLEAFDLYSYNGLGEFWPVEALAMPLDPTVFGAEPPDVVSVSYVECESYLVGSTPMISMSEQIMAMAATIGTSYFAASGDYGSSGCMAVDASDVDAVVSYPASSSWMGAVGGTGVTLAEGPDSPRLPGPDNTIFQPDAAGPRFESTWNDTLFTGASFARSRRWGRHQRSI